MAKKPRYVDNIRIEKGALTPEEAERLFTTVDETGHSDEERAAKQRARRKEKGQGVEVDPLAGDDPSGSDVEKVIQRTAVGFVLAFLIIVTLAQVSCGVIRRVNTANLSQDVSVTTVASALRDGVEWGNGFTQFPEEFTVQEADKNTHRIEVTVLDSSSSNALECFSNAQIQATALSVNALLNPNVNTVIYHVNIYVDEDGNFRTSRLFDFLRPTGETHSFMTFVWTKSTNESGAVVFNCTVQGMNAETQERLRDKITSSYTPFASSKANEGEEKEAPAADDAATGADASDVAEDL